MATYPRIDIMEAVVTAVLHQAAIDASALQPTTTMESLDFDSLDLVVIGYALEERFPGFDEAQTRWSGETTIADIVDSAFKQVGSE